MIKSKINYKTFLEISKKFFYSSKQRITAFDTKDKDDNPHQPLDKKE